MCVCTCKGLVGSFFSWEEVLYQLGKCTSGERLVQVPAGVPMKSDPGTPSWCGSGNGLGSAGFLPIFTGPRRRCTAFARRT